jgi:hypothetical protein
MPRYCADPKRCFNRALRAARWSGVDSRVRPRESRFRCLCHCRPRLLRTSNCQFCSIECGRWLPAPAQPCAAASAARSARPSGCKCALAIAPSARPCPPRCWNGGACVLTAVVYHVGVAPADPSGWDRDAQRAIHESCTRPIPLDQVSERKGPGNQNVYYVDGEWFVCVMESRGLLLAASACRVRPCVCRCKRASRLSCCSSCCRRQGNLAGERVLQIQRLE